MIRVRRPDTETEHLGGLGLSEAVGTVRLAGKGVCDFETLSLFAAHCKLHAAHFYGRAPFGTRPAKRTFLFCTNPTLSPCSDSSAPECLRRGSDMCILCRKGAPGRLPDGLEQSDLVGSSPWLVLAKAQIAVAACSQERLREERRWKCRAGADAQ